MNQSTAQHGQPHNRIFPRLDLCQVPFLLDALCLVPDLCRRTLTSKRCHYPVFCSDDAASAPDRGSSSQAAPRSVPELGPTTAAFPSSSHHWQGAVNLMNLMSSFEPRRSTFCKCKTQSHKQPCILICCPSSFQGATHEWLQSLNEPRLKS